MRPDSVLFTKKNETGLGLGIVNFKKTRPESVSFTQKNETRFGIIIVHFLKGDQTGYSYHLKMVSEE